MGWLLPPTPTSPGSPAGGLCKSPQNGASQDHTFGLLSFSLSEIKIKQIPDGATHSTGQGDTLLRFLQGKPSSSLLPDPPRIASTNRYPAPQPRAPISPQPHRKTNPHCQESPKLQHSSTEPAAPSSGTHAAGLGSPCTNPVHRAAGASSGDSLERDQHPPPHSCPD